MKKFLLLGLFAPYFAYSQVQEKVIRTYPGTKYSNHCIQDEQAGKIYVDGLNATNIVSLGAKKYRATPFATENCSSGSTINLPTGWTTGGSATGCVWVWKNTAFAGTYNIGNIASTSASNGWLGFDSDGIGNSVTSATFSSWTQKTWNCSGHSTVALTFQTKFRKFSDSCMVRVSSNGGINWTNYWIAETNTLLNNGSTANPATVFLNISTVAANQPNVIVRFEYYNTLLGGAYNWLVDDIALSELDPIEVKINKSGFSAFGTVSPFYAYSYSTLPLSLQNTITPFTFYSNLGATALSNVNVNGTYFKGITNVGTTIFTQPTLPVNAIDSGRYASTSFLPTGLGDYKIALSLNLPGDANTTNNNDSVKFSIVDSIYSLNAGLIADAYICHMKATPTSVERSFSIGNIFEVPFADTLTHAFVSFTPTTQIGGQVIAGLYKYDGITWNFVMNSSIKTLSAADISTSTNLIYTRLIFPYTGSLTNLLTPGTYVIAVEANNPTPTSQDIFIYSSQDINVVHTFGVGDTLTAPLSFGGLAPSSWFNIPATPLVAAVFGHSNPVITVDVSDPMSNDIDLMVTPNPASTQVSFQFTLNESANQIQIDIINSLGQVVKTNHLVQAPSYQRTTIDMDIDDLAPGLYFYHIDIDGRKYSNKIVIQ